MNTQRKLLVQAALIAALAVSAPLVTAVPAGAAPATPATTTAPVPAPAPLPGEARTPTAEVDHFFGSYREAVLGTGSRSPEQVREAHLTAELDARLTRWAEENHADPVLRAQNVPEGWRVRHHATTATTVTVILTEIWGTGPDTEVWYTVRRSDLRITDLTDAPGGR
ncbi:hypothetical protein ACIQM4_19475 [Streptomyces sp. NPDC091272]|uniref:hypothetical protein n=1 Tax=Streptomyces sp. NPDC091272 TaxID=3365981 RepID=UPI00381731B1